MSQLRDSYKGYGWKTKELESSADYLADLTLRAATEIDNTTLGRNNNFSHTEELADILGRYQSKRRNTFIVTTHPLYMSLYRALDKRPTEIADLASEMESLSLKLEGISLAPIQEQQAVRDLLVKYSREIRRERRPVRRDLAA